MRGRRPTEELSADEYQRAAMYSKMYRVDNKLTQTDFASQLNTHAYVISHIEREWNTRPTRVVRAILNLVDHAGSRFFKPRI